VGRESGLDRIEIRGASLPDAERVLSREALEFVARLQRALGPRRQELLAAREAREARLGAGERPQLLAQTAEVRRADWQVAPAPADLEDRRVEITGPVDRKMMINALNSGAQVFMADFEDSLSPTWQNVVEGQANLIDAVRRTLGFTSPDGKQYALNAEVATLVVRPRGWHLEEKHMRVDGRPVSASLFDFGLYFFHNARELLARGSGPYFYLPKLESHLEARLWNDAFVLAQDALGIPQGSVRATVLIETILAAFEMDEILHELRDHAAGLNAGRWDYIFSVIKKFRDRDDMVLPDRAQVSMAVPFMAAYANLLVQTCHRRGAHAIGGMAAFIPSRRDPEVNERALAKVREDKDRESSQGFDGTWVAHPDLVPVAREVFDRVLGARPHQKQQRRTEVRVGGEQLLDVTIDGGRITHDGVAHNVGVALRYITAWLEGTGAVAIYNLMEDAATAEISRAQLWQWRRHGCRLEDGTRFNDAIYTSVRDEQLASVQEEGMWGTRAAEAADLLDALVLSDTFVPFLTIPGYDRLINGGAS
jgi:malate synthase